jgi:hypothetical protein
VAQAWSTPFIATPSRGPRPPLVDAELDDRIGTPDNSRCFARVDPLPEAVCRRWAQRSGLVCLQASASMFWSALRTRQGCTADQNKSGASSRKRECAHYPLRSLHKETDRPLRRVRGAPDRILFESRGSSRARLSASREPGGVAAYGCVGPEGSGLPGRRRSVFAQAVEAGDLQYPSDHVAHVA